MKPLAMCVPCDIAPNFPATATDSIYERAPCPECQRDMWLGTRIKTLVEAGAAYAVCMLCAIRNHGATDPAKLTRLTDLDKHA
jgi:hypothetical protein